MSRRPHLTGRGNHGRAPLTSRAAHPQTRPHGWKEARALGRATGQAAGGRWALERSRGSWGRPHRCLTYYTVLLQASVRRKPPLVQSLVRPGNPPSSHRLSLSGAKLTAVTGSPSSPTGTAPALWDQLHPHTFPPGAPGSVLSPSGRQPRTDTRTPRLSFSPTLEISPVTSPAGLRPKVCEAASWSRPVPWEDLALPPTGRAAARLPGVCPLPPYPPPHPDSYPFASKAVRPPYSRGGRSAQTFRAKSPSPELAPSPASARSRAMPCAQSARAVAPLSPPAP